MRLPNQVSPVHRGVSDATSTGSVGPSGCGLGKKIACAGALLACGALCVGSGGAACAQCLGGIGASGCIDCV